MIKSVQLKLEDLKELWGFLSKNRWERRGVEDLDMTLSTTNATSANPLKKLHVFKTGDLHTGVKI